MGMTIGGLFLYWKYSRKGGNFSKFHDTETIKITEIKRRVTEVHQQSMSDAMRIQTGRINPYSSADKYLQQEEDGKEAFERTRGESRDFFLAPCREFIHNLNNRNLGNEESKESQPDHSRFKEKEERKNENKEFVEEVKEESKENRQITETESDDESGEQELPSYRVNQKAEKILERAPEKPYNPCEIDFDISCCIVCLKNFKTGNKVRIMPDCKHIFHSGCIEEWICKEALCKPKVLCPHCRFDLGQCTLGEREFSVLDQSIRSFSIPDESQRSPPERPIAQQDLEIQDPPNRENIDLNQAYSPLPFILDCPTHTRNIQREEESKYHHHRTSEITQFPPTNLCLPPRTPSFEDPQPNQNEISLSHSDLDPEESSI